MAARDDAKIDYESGMLYKDIAVKYKVSESTVKSWASRYWNRDKAATRNRSKTQPSSDKRLQLKVDKKMSDAVEKNDKLSQQQKDFCLYFMRNRNAAQAYLKAYGCAYTTACTNGSLLLSNTKIKHELQVLRDIKNAALGDLCGDDVVELHMRIAFSDITDCVEFSSKRAITMRNGAPVYVKDPKTGEDRLLTHFESEVRVKDSSTVDGSLIAEITQGREGLKIKLADKQRSLKFLENYFGLNPMDTHRKDFDNARLEIERKKLELIENGEDAEGEDTSETDGLIYG